MSNGTLPAAGGRIVAVATDRAFRKSNQERFSLRVAKLLKAVVDLEGPRQFKWESR